MNVPAAPELNVLAGGRSDDARIVVETWAEFRDETPELVAYLVEGLIPEGSLTFLAAPPKGGKTWLGAALALCCATGSPYLARFPILEPAPVLYLALEGNRSALRARIGAMARGLGVDPDEDNLLGNLAISYRPIGIDLSNPAWTDDLREHVERLGARLVVVDVLRAAAPRLRESGEGAGDFAVILAQLAPIFATGCAVVLLHHFIKPGDASRSRSIGERMTGSGALFGAADLVLGITGSDPRNMRIEAIGRDAATPEPFGVLLDGEGHGPFGGFGYRDALRVTATDDAPPPTSSKPPLKGDPAEIAAYLRSRPTRDARPREIKAKFGIGDGTLIARRDALAALGVHYQAAGSLSTYYVEPLSTTPQPSIEGCEE